MENNHLKWGEWFMRTAAEMMNLIMSKAMNDDKLRAVAMAGSRANRNAVHDQYSDFNIVYFVTNVREFTKDKSWVKCFGDILIVQYPMDWYSHPYDYTGKNTFSYLVQFADGNRIDLSIVDISNIEKEKDNDEPRIILLNKDNYKELIPIESIILCNITTQSGDLAKIKSSNEKVRTLSSNSLYNYMRNLIYNLLEQKIDIIISDIEIPQETGLELLKWIREEKMECEILLLTCHENFVYAMK